MPVNRFDPSPGDPTESARQSVAEDEPPRAESGGPEAIERLHRQLEELVEYGRLYLAARGDAILASVRRLGLWLVAGCVALVVLAAMLAASAVIGILGVADLVGQALGDRPGAGYMITGFGLLAICALTLAIGLVLVARSFRNKTVEKYGRRHKAQRARFGHDVSGQAARQTERS